MYSWKTQVYPKAINALYNLKPYQEEISLFLTRQFTIRLGYFCIFSFPTPDFPCSIF